jgi:hypothetical protein
MEIKPLSLKYEININLGYFNVFLIASGTLSIFAICEDNIIQIFSRKINIRSTG